MTKVIRKKQPSTKESTNIILLQKLQNAVNKKVFLRDDVSLVELAARLGTNRTYLSDLYMPTMAFRFPISSTAFV